MEKKYAVCINSSECNRDLHNQKTYEIVEEANFFCYNHKVLVNGKIQSWNKNIFGPIFQKNDVILNQNKAL